MGNKKKRAREPDALDPTKDWSLDAVLEKCPPASDAVLRETRDSLVRAQGKAALRRLGAGFKTETILAEVPSFAIGALLALDELEQDGVELPEGFSKTDLRFLVVETIRLRAMNQRWENETRRVDTNLTQARSELKRLNSLALRRRRSIAKTLLRMVVPAGAPARDSIRKASGKAATPEAAASSVDAIAGVLEELRADPQLVSVLDQHRLTAATVTSLRALAEELRAAAGVGTRKKPPQATSQRALDVQDGIVLNGVRHVWGALKEAELDGAEIEMPPLDELYRLVAGSTAVDETEEDLEAAPEEPDTDAADTEEAEDNEDETRPT